MFYQLKISFIKFYDMLKLYARSALVEIILRNIGLGLKWNGQQVGIYER